jgi:hypothetical protein
MRGQRPHNSPPQQRKNTLLLIPQSYENDDPAQERKQAALVDPTRGQRPAVCSTAKERSLSLIPWSHESTMAVRNEPSFTGAASLILRSHGSTTIAVRQLTSFGSGKRGNLLCPTCHFLCYLLSKWRHDSPHPRCWRYVRSRGYRHPAFMACPQVLRTNSWLQELDICSNARKWTSERLCHPQRR